MLCNSSNPFKPYMKKIKNSSNVIRRIKTKRKNLVLDARYVQKFHGICDCDERRDIREYSSCIFYPSVMRRESFRNRFNCSYSIFVYVVVWRNSFYDILREKSKG